MNKVSWTQSELDFPLKEVRRGVYRKYNAHERRVFVDGWLRDENIGTQHLRFTVTAVEPLGGDTYRVKLNASMIAIKKIVDNWASGQYYTINGKRMMT